MNYSAGNQLYSAWVVRQLLLNGGGIWPKWSQLSMDETIQWCERAKDPSWKKIL
jgi:hypothetical protein